MSSTANLIIDGLGGTTAVAELIKAPLSTVHSWRKNGISVSRMDHLRLAAKEVGLEFPVVHTDGNASTRGGTSPGNADNVSAGVLA